MLEFNDVWAEDYRKQMKERLEESIYEYLEEDRVSSEFVDVIRSTLLNELHAAQIRVQKIQDILEALSFDNPC